MYLFLLGTTFTWSKIQHAIKKICPEKSCTHTCILHPNPLMISTSIGIFFGFYSSRVIKANASIYKYISHLISQKVAYHIHCFILFYTMLFFSYQYILKFFPHQYIEIFFIHFHSCMSYHHLLDQTPFAEYHNWVHFFFLTNNATMNNFIHVSFHTCRDTSIG